MGRPPCCDKVEIRKGPWTPEEDIILLSYIQEHGPGKWRSVPINTCLMRCSKSCRLRWTNYLRPGIKHGNFTPHEEDIIVRLQSFLGNKWATIASYLPQRTDSNIKNYWYTHLKKKLNKHQVIGAIISPPPPPSEPSIVASHVDHHHDRTRTHPLCKDSYARPTSSNPADEVTQPIGQCSPITTTNGYYNSSSSYAFSVDNISKLLNGFKKSTPTQGDATNIKPSSAIYNNALFPFEHMSGGALTPISEVPPLMPLPPPQEKLSSIEDWLCHQATEQVVDQLAEISDVCCSSFPMLL